MSPETADNKVRILIIDDQQATHHRVAGIFFHNDYEFDHAYDLPQAMRALRLSRDKYDAVILSDALPNQDSSRFLTEVQRQFGSGHPPIVYYWEDRRAMADAYTKGVRRFVSKMGGPLEMRRVVGDALAAGWRRSKELARQAARGEPRCECGAKYTSFPDHHSTWCPLIR